MVHPILFDPVGSPYLVPFDESFKHDTRRAVAEIIVGTLKQLALECPSLPPGEVAELSRVKREDRAPGRVSRSYLVV